MPQFRAWIASTGRSQLVEPFAGGAIASVTAVLEYRVDRALLIDKDPRITTLWKAIVTRRHRIPLIKLIRDFPLTSDSVVDFLSAPHTSLSVAERAFQVLLTNRVNHGGIMTDGPHLMARGEDGKGIASRWYPSTLIGRINLIGHYEQQFSVLNGDGIEWMAGLSEGHRWAAFVDPPYIDVGPQLYRYGDCDFPRLFSVLGNLPIPFSLTVSDDPRMHEYAKDHRFGCVKGSMRSGHGAKTRTELIFKNSHPWPAERSVHRQRALFAERGVER
jgi:DNA adenine methylase